MRKTHSLQGERWDQLCYRAFGVSSEAGVTALRDANPDAVAQSDPFVLPAGLLIMIPDITLTVVEVVEVAPWQR